MGCEEEGRGGLGNNDGVQRYLKFSVIILRPVPIVGGICCVLLGIAFVRYEDKRTN